jgi:tetratricopeptide (TPR) repeat protein
MRGCCQTAAVPRDLARVDVPVTDRPLRLSIDVSHDWLVALEFGCVLDGQPEDHYIKLSDALSFIRRSPGGEVIGFSISGLSRLDTEHPVLWEPPLLDLPELGLDAAPPGAVLAAARRAFPDLSTADVILFEAAVEAEGPEQAALAWRLCLGAGDMRAHFGLGYTLCDLGRHRDAYPHLRRYCELVPHNSWAWCWLGKACVGIGELSEARSAFGRAVGIEDEGGYATDARECLSELTGEAESPGKRRPRRGRDEQR